MQSGAYAGRRIRRQLSGRPPAASHSATSTSARRRTSPEAGRWSPPARCSCPGCPGWLSWLFIHIAFLTGYRNRFTAVMTWLVAFSRGVRRERAFTTQEIETRQDVFSPGPRTVA